MHANSGLTCPRDFIAECFNGSDVSEDLQLEYNGTTVLDIKFTREGQMDSVCVYDKQGMDLTGRF
jgi:hypothetical protein